MIYQHYKGGIYKVLFRDVIDVDTLAPHVIYISLTGDARVQGRIFSREQGEFDGMVEHEGRIMKRFTELPL